MIVTGTTVRDSNFAGITGNVCASASSPPRKRKTIEAHILTYYIFTMTISNNLFSCFFNINQCLTFFIFYFTYDPHLWHHSLRMVVCTEEERKASKRISDQLKNCDKELYDKYIIDDEEPSLGIYSKRVY